MEQKNKSRTRVKIAVSIVLAVHGIGLVGLLMAGCQKEKEPATPPTPQEAAATNTAPVLETPTNTAPADTNPVTPPTTGTVTPPIPPVAPVAPAAGAQDIKIAAGETLSDLTKKYHVSLKALLEANPGIQPTKLQIGQVVHIPAPVAPTTPTPAATTPTVDTASGEKLYEVKSGDTLSSIATHQGTTIRALRTANNLKTDRIIVGQKLKIPAKATPPPAAPTNPPAQ